MVVSKRAEPMPSSDSLSEPQESVRMLNALVNIGCMVVSMDKDGGIRYCSPALSEKLGTAPLDRESFVSTVGETEPIRRQVQDLTESFEENPRSIDLYISGDPYRLTGITVPGSSPLRMLVLSDIAGEALGRKQMERMERLATVGQVAAGAVHEFNNNLTSILGWAQIAEQNTAPDSPSAAAIGIIAENAKKARRIFSKLLNMSRSKMDDDFYAPVSPVKVADDALGILFFELKTRGIKLTRSYNDVELCLLDEDRICQVFINIIKNAMEAMDRNGELTVSAVKDGNAVRISFKDTGPGMSKETAARVFESFFTTKKMDEAGINGGTGLGLSISLDIVRQHGGDIELLTERGLGACFTVVLPSLENSTLIERPSFVSRPTIPPGAIVLVVDDEPDIGEMIRMSLELKGVSVLSVQSGEEALVQLNRLPFDAAFVDYSMPGLSGHDLGARIMEVQPNLPVVFMSGLTVEIDSVVGDFIKKPFDLDEIQAKLYQVLKRKKDAETLA